MDIRGGVCLVIAGLVLVGFPMSASGPGTGLGGIDTAFVGGMFVWIIMLAHALNRREERDEQRER